MPLSFFSGGKGSSGGSVNELIARRKYEKAIELLRGEFRAGKRDSRLRLQLADVLVMAGKGREAVPVLLGLADEFAREGFAAKAISVLKKVQKVEPSRHDVEAKLAELIKQKNRDLPPLSGGLRAAAPEIGIEEIGLDMAPASSAAPVPAAPPVPELQPPGLAEFQLAAGTIAEPEPESAPGPIDSLGDDLLGVIEDVLKETPPAALAQAGEPAGNAAAESPLFSSFSQEELVAVIQGLKLLSFEPGDIVITEGEAGDSLFVLTSGIVKAFVRNPAGHSVPVREMNEGAFFGEISILSGQPRTATITAKTACELLELDRATLDSIGASHPNVKDVLQKFYEQRLKSEQEQRARAADRS